MIFFFCNMWPHDDSRGITKKCFSQINAMNEIGYKVDFYTGYEDDGVCVYDSYGNVVKKQLYPYSNRLIIRVLRNYYLKKICLEFLTNVEYKTKIFYARYLFFDSLTRNMFKTAKKREMATILEIHSYPCYFWGDYKLIPIYIRDFINRKSTIKYIDRIAAMTDVKRIWGKETINFENGIDLQTIQPHIRIREKNIIRIVAVSYEWKVHGYDRILKGLYDYYQCSDSKYEVKIVFVGTILASTRRLIKSLKLEKYVYLAGIKRGKDLDLVYNQCDIGMGCLALHRRSENAVSDLKSREYIAKGIPYIYAGNQLGSDEKFRYSLKIPSGEEAVDINRIIDFYESFVNDTDIVKNMRDYALNFSWYKQMEKIFSGLKI